MMYPTGHIRGLVRYVVMWRRMLSFHDRFFVHSSAQVEGAPHLSQMSSDLGGFVNRLELDGDVMVTASLESIGTSGPTPSLYPLISAFQ